MYLNPNAAWLLKSQGQVNNGTSKSTGQACNIRKPEATLTSKANETSEATKPSEKSMAYKNTMAPGKLVLKPEDTGRLRS